MPAHAAHCVIAGLTLWGLLGVAMAQETASSPQLPELLPHHVVYELRLDDTRPSGQVDYVAGKIDYRITGNRCAGYETETRQTSEISTGALPNRQQVHASSWEDGAARAYRFTSTTTASDAPRKQIGADVERDASGVLEVSVTRPEARTFSLEGHVLLPTEHVRRILVAAGDDQRQFSARVYDGASDIERVYQSLAVIGRKQTGVATEAPSARGLSEDAASALEGVAFYPVIVSYYDENGSDDTPAYVMSFALYENGVLGKLKIDYGRFAILGTMTGFETLGRKGC